MLYLTRNDGDDELRESDEDTEQINNYVKNKKKIVKNDLNFDDDDHDHHEKNNSFAVNIINNLLSRKNKNKNEFNDEKHFYYEEPSDQMFYICKFFKFFLFHGITFLQSIFLQHLFKVTVQNTGGFVSFWPKTCRFSKLF